MSFLPEIDFWKMNEENFVHQKRNLMKVCYMDVCLFRIYRLQQQRTFEIEQISHRDYDYFFQKYSCCYCALVK